MPAAGTVHEVSATPMLRPLALTWRAISATCVQVAALLGRGAGDLLDQHGDADAAPAGGPGAVLDGDVVVGDHGDDLGAGLAAASSAAMSKFITSPV